MVDDLLWMIEAGDEVRYFRPTLDELLKRRYRQIDVDGGNEVDETVATISVEGEKIAEIGNNVRLETL